MNKILVRSIFVNLLLNASLFASGLEVITSFDSLITVNADATMLVQETIHYTNHGVMGLHGIFRDFPTHYHDAWGNKVVIGFEVTSVMRNGKAVPYHVTSQVNGKRIYIGDADRVVPPGNYIYTITYTTNRQLGFFKDHDELYWNVTGNGWKFPILHATAQVKLPNVPADKIKVIAYTGYQDERGQAYQAHVNQHGVSFFETIQPLKPRQGLTIVVAWPKGYVQAPTWWTALKYFLDDNKGVLWLLIGLILLLCIYVKAYLTFRRNQQALQSTIIPRFYPPKGMVPSAARYIMRKGFDAKAFGAEIVNMAVHGLLTIEHVYATLFTSPVYTLKAKEMPSQETSDDFERVHLHAALYKVLFEATPVLKISQVNHAYVATAIDRLKSKLHIMYGSCFDFKYKTIGFCGFLSFVFAGSALMIPGTVESGVAWLIIVLYVLMAIIAFLSLRGYTKKGMQLHDEIEGFKLFLATTETDRLQMIGTPPTKTPELYETYLPYAMALGVEQQWSQQFAALFEQFAREGHPYVPLWYLGPTPSFSPSFASNFSDALSSTISSSATPPGRSSGFSSGGGRSGGGGGGGGGGSW